MLEGIINTRPTSCGILRSGIYTRVDTRPRTPLSVGFVYVRTHVCTTEGSTRDSASSVQLGTVSHCSKLNTEGQKCELKFKVRIAAHFLEISKNDPKGEIAKHFNSGHPMGLYDVSIHSRL